MNFSDKIQRQSRINGVFILRQYDAEGNLVDEYQDRNLVVTGGREATTLLIGGNGTDKNIDRIAFGSNGADPVVTDSAITDEFAKAVNAITYPSTDSVQFDFSLELNENNGTTIREYGLLCVDNTLFARKTRSPIVKDNTVRLEGTWTLNF
jgi:hypothetical protein